jgi:hypothetical protein
MRFSALWFCVKVLFARALGDFLSLVLLRKYCQLRGFRSRLRCQVQAGAFCLSISVVVRVFVGFDRFGSWAEQISDLKSNCNI